jgi:hypothetical protein
MNYLLKAFNEIKDLLYHQQKIESNEWFRSELKELESKNISFGIFIGSYDYDGFNIAYELNNNNIHSSRFSGVMIDDSFDFVDYLKKYYDRQDYNATCQLQIRINIDTTDNDILDKLQYNILFIEYNGYELYYGTL